MHLFVMLLSFVFNAYIFILLVRLLLQKFGASWTNPISQLVVKLTEPVIKPLRKFIPGFKGFDLAIVVAIFVIQLIAVIIIIGIKVNLRPSFFGSIVIAIGYLGYKLADIYIWGIILSAVMSWVPALQHNPLAAIINTITEPLMKLGRRFVPKIGGLDLSPIPLILLLWIVRAFVFQSIIVYGIRLAYVGAHM